MHKIFLRKNINRRVENGHPWVFGNEVDLVKSGFAAGSYADLQPGDIVEVYTPDNKFIGRGYFNAKSQIMVRILTRNRQEVIDEAFFLHRIRLAWAYRQKIGYTENCRLVFGEADDMPALIIDKFNDYFVLQTLAFGMDKWKAAIVKALEQVFSPKGIYERNDVPVRELEGMDQVKGFLSEPFDTNIIIKENGLKFHVDIENGQKTGYFLDQQDNRRAIQNIVTGANVLEAFCYTGTFSLHAAHYGAKSVHGIDISENAVAQSRRNAQLNGLQDICSFEACNAFDALKTWSKDGSLYDVVIIDPPAFTKSRENIQKAIAGYKEINLRAMKLVKPGGFLVTASCTNLVQPALFLEIIEMAAKDARKKLRQVTYQTQAGDHPIVWGLENTGYLKFLIVEVS
ncbi:MAG: class I SAM-dependent rRNA methyltransferase [Chitinophagaceae bacterium]